MRCLYCHDWAGLIRKVCPTCSSVVGVVQRVAGQVGWTELVDEFAAAGLTQAQVGRVLDAEVGDRPALRDELTAKMANALMRGLGMPGRQSPEDVQRVRRAATAGNGEGAWTSEGARALAHGEPSEDETEEGALPKTDAAGEA
jgi:hypothetical protein